MDHSTRRRAARLGRPLLLILLAAAAAVLLRRPRPRPDVLLITIDTLRADALTPDDTPALLDLAARGVRFLRARAPAPLTLPSHATLLTGLEPPAHGLRDNTAPALPRGRGFPLLAEEFAAEGYATAAFVASAVLDPRYGLDAGFHEYRHPAREGAGAALFAALPAEEQVARVRAWLAQRPAGRPVFVWVHLWDPHAPYAPYPSDARGRPGTADGDPPAERYRGEVCRADAAVEELLALVHPETTVVVVASDHGEGLGEHGEDTHGHLCYGATLDVPLLLAGPGVPAGRAEDAPAGLADVAPTLRRLCRLPARETDGEDLLALPAARVLCGESLYAHRLYRWAQQSAATDGRFTLVDGGPRLELFDRAADPGEREPLARPAEWPEYERLDRALAAYRQRRGPGGRGAEIAAPLYYGIPVIPAADFLPVAENRGLPDVAPRLGAVRLLGDAAEATAARSVPLSSALLPRLEALEREDARNPAPCLARGRILLLVLGRAAEAAAALEEAIRRGYGSADVWQLLVRAYEEAGDPEGAARARKKQLR